MRKFIIKILIFLFPLSFFLIEGFLPLNSFTYRPWESLSFNDYKSNMPFFPNEKIKMISEGDLCYYTENACKKNENWTTDKIGYRNDNFVSNPDILLIGDSFIAGSGNTQDFTITNQLKLLIKNDKIYNIAPASINDFKSLYENQIIQKPKVVILSKVERNALPKINLNSKKKISYNYIKFKILKNKFTRFYFLKYMRSRIKNQYGVGTQSPINPKMFFLNGIKQVDNVNNINTSVNTIKSYKKYFDSLGIQFIFLPIPNKETVYYEEVPFENQPKYINMVCNELDKLKITNINSVSEFNRFRNNHKNTLIYHLDDSHWNSKGINIIAKKIIQVLPKEINQ